MMDRNLKCNINYQLFKRFADKIEIFLSNSNTKGSNYDPYHNTGYVTTNSNPIFVRALVKHLSPESRALQEIGITESGTIECTINEKDVTLFKNANKIKYDNEEYSIYHNNLGNRFQIRKTQTGFYSVILFRKGN